MAPPSCKDPGSATPPAHACHQRPATLRPHRFGRRLRFQACCEAQPLSRHGKKVTRATQDQRALRPRLQKSTAHGSNQCDMSDLALIAFLNRDHIVSHEDFTPVQFMHVSLYWLLLRRSLFSIYPNMDTCTALCVPQYCSPWHRRC